jgi:hypothetical protein
MTRKSALGKNKHLQTQDNSTICAATVGECEIKVKGSGQACPLHTLIVIRGSFI